MPEERVYTVKITNTPDGDGDYAARIYVDGSEHPTMILFSKERETLRPKAEEWVERHRDYDAADVETIQL